MNLVELVTSFKILDQFGERGVSRDTAKNMDVIVHSAHPQWVAIQTP
jgi:hypothetical protein